VSGKLLYRLVRKFIRSVANSEKRNGNYFRMFVNGDMENGRGGGKRKERNVGRKSHAFSFSTLRCLLTSIDT